VLFTVAAIALICFFALAFVSLKEACQNMSRFSDRVFGDAEFIAPENTATVARDPASELRFTHSLLALDRAHLQEPGGSPEPELAESSSSASVRRDRS